VRVLLTRPRPDSELLAADLSGRGIETLIEPLLDIELSAGPALDLSRVQALLATSANGVRAFAGRNSERQLTVYAVGDATAREAKSAGFSDVRSAAGDVETLADLVIQSADPSAGTCLHPAGTRVAGDLAGLLGAAGFGYHREVLYTARTATAFSDNLCRQITHGKLDGVLLFSPRTGTTFSRLITAAGRAGDAWHLTAYCLSPAVAETIQGLPWARIAVAVRPEQPALLNLLSET